MRSIYVSLVLVVLLGTGVAFLSSGDEIPYPELRTSTIGGRVVDANSFTPCQNYTVKLTAPDLVPEMTGTDDNGWYRFNVTVGNYTVHVHDSDGMEVGRKNVKLGDETGRRIDFLIDLSDPYVSTLHGKVEDSLGRKIESARVVLRDSSGTEINGTGTMDNGSYSLKSPPGDYQLYVEYRGEDEYIGEVSLDWEEDLRYDIELEGLIRGPLLSWSEISDFFSANWVNLLAILGIIVAVFLVQYLIHVFVSSREGGKEEPDWSSLLIKMVSGLCWVVLVAGVSWQISKVSPAFDRFIWRWLSLMAIPAVVIVVSVFSVRISMILLDLFWSRIRRGEERPETPGGQLSSYLSLTTRYLVLLIAGVIILLSVLYSLGLRQEISEATLSFLSDKGARIIFLAVLIVIAVLLRKFIDVFFQEIAGRSEKVSESMVNIGKKATQGGVYFILALIFIFTLLSIAGMGEIGQTLILVVSMIVGLVVSFAATGSIGNMLSGLVLLLTKPYDVGDRIEMTDIILGDVTHVGIMFTRVSDLDGKVMEVPNNNVLSSRIINYSRSSRERGFAINVRVTLGYEIPPKKVRSLMKLAARNTEGVLDDPSPRVLTTEFQNHAVEYLLRAYTKDPVNMLHIRSSVMENMLDIFQSEGLEILSPLYHVKREGKTPSSDEIKNLTAEKKEDESTGAEGLSMFNSIEEENSTAS